MAGTVRLVEDMAQVRRALTQLLGPNVCIQETPWLAPIERLLGSTLAFEDLVDTLEAAAMNSGDPTCVSVSADAWAKRISRPVAGSDPDASVQ